MNKWKNEQLSNIIVETYLPLTPLFQRTSGKSLLVPPCYSITRHVSQGISYGLKICHISPIFHYLVWASCFRSLLEQRVPGTHEFCRNTLYSGGFLSVLYLAYFYGYILQVFLLGLLLKLKKLYIFFTINHQKIKAEWCHSVPCFNKEWR